MPPGSNVLFAISCAFAISCMLTACERRDDSAKISGKAEYDAAIARTLESERRAARDARVSAEAMKERAVIGFKDCVHIFSMQQPPDSAPQVVASKLADMCALAHDNVTDVLALIEPGTDLDRERFRANRGNGDARFSAVMDELSALRAKELPKYEPPQKIIIAAPETPAPTPYPPAPKTQSF